LSDSANAARRFSGINGGVEISFADDVNADLDVSGINGNVNTELSNVTIQGKMEKNNFRAKIGAGGSPDSYFRHQWQSNPRTRWLGTIISEWSITPLLTKNTAFCDFVGSVLHSESFCQIFYNSRA